MSTVLHVTECYEGGVGSAVRKIAALTPEHQHFLLFEGKDAEDPLLFERSMAFEGTGVIARARELSRRVRELQPDLVHLHSSWAGVYGRIFGLGVPTVYEPHCYKFDDPELFALSRSVFRAAERVLARRFGAVVSLSPHETKLALGLNPNSIVHFLPNAPSVPVREPRPRMDAKVGRDVHVVMMGRICPQKDPEYFVEVVKELRIRSDRAWRFTWLGDGDPQLASLLHREDITISGWLDGEQVVRSLDSASVYVHSARYEGFPVSVLDAAARRLPLFARSIPSFEGTPLVRHTSPRDMASRIVEALDDPVVLERNLDEAAALLEMMNDEAQRHALRSIYGSAPAFNEMSR